MVGDKVCAIEFTNCFGEFVEGRPDLTIKRIRFVKGIGIPDYYRLYCEDKNGMYVEGSERYFVPENIFVVRKWSNDD